jgi:S1-C subfamily serine protease
MRTPTHSLSLELILTAVIAVMGSSGRAGLAPLQQSVVKIYVTMQREDYAQPWQAFPPASGNGSGFIIEGNRILSNAHVVSDARFIEVQREGDPRKYEARVLFPGHDCDLALLTVKDPAFFAGTKPLSLGKRLPSLNDEVIVLGYPMGGARISLTQGVVSRIDYNLYAHSGIDSHLVLQVDAAINPGNSGGPVLFNGRVIGLAFQGIAGAQNIGYAIPLPVLQHFLKDVEDGTYDGYPELGVMHVDTRNPALRADLKLADTQTGVAVAYVDPYGAAAGFIQPRDVLLSVDGLPIANDGSVSLAGTTVEYTELMERKQSGETIAFDVWRNGARLPLTIPLANRVDPFAFRYAYDRKPDYYMVGGLVFAPLSRGYLSTLGGDLGSPAAQRLLYCSQYAKVDNLYTNREQFVVLTTRLAHPVNTYSDGFLNQIVATINDVPIGRLSDIPLALARATRGFNVIRFDGNDNPLILDARAAAAAESEIMAKYGLTASTSLGREDVP